MSGLSDSDLAVRLAETAGQMLMAMRDSGTLSGKALGAAGDSAANAFLMAALAEQRPDDGVLSEESKDGPERLAKNRVWIIDPLDGTREYGEGRSDWAVHVALAIDGVATVGAVALPGQGQTMRSDDPAALPDEGTPLRMLVSRSRPAPQALAVAEALGATLVPMGSAGAKAMAVIQGEADVYLHAGGQYEWDSAAPVAVALAHGLHCSRIDGSPMQYNCADPYLPDLLLCRPERAEAILHLIASVGS